MPDFESPPRSNLTRAEYACRYLIERVRCDADFRYLMMGTNGLALCFEALDGRVPSLGELLANEYLRDNREPEVIALRRRVERLKDDLPGKPEKWDRLIEAQADACLLRVVLRTIHEHLAAGETLAGDQWLPGCKATILREIERAL